MKFYNNQHPSTFISLVQKRYTMYLDRVLGAHKRGNCYTALMLSRGSYLKQPKSELKNRLSLQKKKLIPPDLAKRNFPLTFIIITPCQLISRKYLLYLSANVSVFNLGVINESKCNSDLNLEMNIEAYIKRKEYRKHHDMDTIQNVV